MQNLRTIGFPVDEILAQKNISRYDVTRLLNAVECTDCINPGQEQINKYSEIFWGNFIIRPGEDFRDILFQEALYRGNSYYYCVAYAADNEYMNGYPIATSPICGGLFCGVNDTTKAEFLQIVVNIIEKYTFQRYSINWSEVQERRNAVTPNSYTDRYMNELDDSTIAAGVARCGTTDCPLTDRWEFKTYRKYCTFELEKCGNKTYGYLRAGRWPVAELNVLEKEGIIGGEKNIEDTIHDPVDGEYVIATLGRLFPIVRCEFNTDYDCDKITNHNDNCPNAYNPSQKDLDNDGIGNVCDQDIDADGVTNPIGIVDDKDNIIVSQYDPKMDNCLFTPNSTQTDRNKDKIGDACDGNEEFISLRIEPKNTNLDSGLSIELIAHTEGTFKDIEWDFGDGTKGKGINITHTYANGGRYTIIAKAQGVRNDAIAKSTVIVSSNSKDIYALRPKPSKLHGTIPFLLEHAQDFSSEEQGVTTEILINQQKDKTISSSQKYSKTFDKNGTYTINASIKNAGKILAVSQYNVGVGENNIGSRLETTDIVYEVGEEVNLETLFEGNTILNKVKDIERNFGDGEKLKTTSFDYKKQFEKKGRKVIVQNINFEDGSVQQNFITLAILESNENQNNFQNIALSTEPGYIQGGENISYEIKEFQVNDNDVIKKIINFDDEQTNDGSETVGSHTYSQGGIYFPSVSYYMNQCNSLHAQSTVVVNNSNNCLTATINGTLDQFSCDLDEDSIPDICDEDIDGDGVRNELGLIMFENSDCSFDNNINETRFQEHIEGICLLDNCPFITNENQSDSDSNGIGDGCNNLVNGLNTGTDLSEIDSDGDSYTDDRDACQFLPEIFNGIEDGDGCPEIGEADPCVDEINIPSFITAINCNSCPCQFADFGNKLQADDSVRAILTDLIGTKDYTRSIPYLIQ